MAEINQTSGGGNKKSGLRRTRLSTRIDMTPMVDLAFLLLTFFIMTTTFMKPFVLKMAVPDEATLVNPPPPISAKRVLTLILGENNKVYWYQGVDNANVESSNFSQNGIRKVLREKKASIDKMYVLIKPSDKSKYQNVIDVLDEMFIGNIEQYALVDITAEDEMTIKGMR